MRDFDKQMEMVLYHSDEGDVSVDAYIMNDSLWITQKTMAELFGVDKSGISRHLKKIFESGELDEKVVVAKIATTSPHGAIPGKTQDKESMFYNLDAIISVGYRVNSIKATKFRIWATTVLKDNGRISHKQAMDKANAEYEIFNKTQPIESDFDKVIKEMIKEQN
ncbi:MAG: virulence RhuM family protein [Eubacterium sp.]|nr:virulence RhuM family protein [Eubacterium sp.]